VSRLVNPGAGEIFDRLTILQLKQSYAAEQGRDTGHWKTEAAALLVKVQARALSGVTLEQILELSTVNALIWHAEDDLRAWRIPSDRVYTTADLDQIRILAFRLQRVNDRRAQLVTMINCNIGDDAPKEKV
jgi:hypothetical protein